jgi:hypothetical protein
MTLGISNFSLRRRHARSIQANLIAAGPAEIFTACKPVSTQWVLTRFLLKMATRDLSGILLGYLTWYFLWQPPECL